MKYFGLWFDPAAPAGLARQPRGMWSVEAARQPTVPLTLDEDPVDFQANFLLWPICSARLRAILDTEKSPADRIEWIPPWN